MGNILKPMLGVSITRDELVARLAVGPLLASSKLDGVRALVVDGVVLSRSLKPIPNAHVQALFGKKEFEGFDGELIVGDPTVKMVYRDTCSGVMSPDGEPDVIYHVFDLWNIPNTPFHDRSAQVLQRVARARSRAVAVLQTQCTTINEVEAFFETMLDMGYEGAVLRAPLTLYKFGRSTVKEGGLLKMKPFEDAEAVVVGTIELMHNENVAFKNELGRTARSSAKAGKVAGGVLGALVCKTPEGVEFEIGTGFTARNREALWNDRATLVGLTVKYKYLKVGGYDKPRSAVFLGWRDERDM